MIRKINFAYIFLFLAVLFWSGNFLVGKYASYHQIPPFSLNFYRWLFAWLILIPFTYNEIILNKNSRSAKLRYAVRNDNSFIYPKELENKFKNYFDLEKANL